MLSLCKRELEAPASTSKNNKKNEKTLDKTPVT